jgi:hypothetical protein
LPESVFYSWQSDLPNSSNRGFLQNILDAVAKKMVDPEGHSLIVVDRDTQGMSGSPDISQAILAKIDKATVFVADVSIVQRGVPAKLSGEQQPQSEIRATPNPNVMFELGYALKTMGWDRVVLIFNEAYGKVNELPFDIAKKRLLTYSFDSAQEKKESKSDLIKKMQEAIEATIRDAKVTPTAELKLDVLAALESKLNANSPAATASIHDLWNEVLEQMKSTVSWADRTFHENPLTYERFVEFLELLDPCIEKFSVASYKCASHKNLEALRALYGGFLDLMPLCDVPTLHSGSVYNQNYDLFRWCGYEMFVALVAALVRFEYWDALDELLPETWGLNRYRQTERFSTLFSRYLYIFDSAPNPKQKVGLISEFLVKRHSEAGRLVKACPLKDFQAGDFFLLWYQAAVREDPQRYTEERWVPWSLANAREAPVFVGRATSSKFAQRLMTLLHLETLDELRSALAKAKELLKSYFGGVFGSPPFCEHIVPSSLGTR